jgi:hypothetical protein
VPRRVPPQAGDNDTMPVPSRKLKDLIEGTVDHHASLTHPDLQEITIRWRGSFGYMDAWAGEGDDNDERIPLCRIEYLGDDEDWGFAIYDPATETYTPALLATGEPAGHPDDAYDTAAIVHLADYKK